MRYVVQFSGGGGSWAAAKRVAERHGTDEMLLLFADVLIEDRDCYRFLVEGAADVFGVVKPADLLALVAALPEVQDDLEGRKAQLAVIRETANALWPWMRWIAEGRTPQEVFKAERMLGNSRFDPCSKLLKRQLIDGWKTANCDPADTECVVGIDWTEKHRYDALAARWAAKASWRYVAPLCDPPFVTRGDVQQQMAAAGLEVPLLYRLGFSHNNCGGGCIKAGQGHWALLLRTMPERYAWWEQQEEDMRAYLGRDVSMMTDRRGGKKKLPLTLATLRKRYPTPRRPTHSTKERRRPMQITTVTYRRLKSFGNYEHEAVEATATIQYGESEEEVLTRLREWVTARLAVAEHAAETRHDVRQLAHEKHSLEQSVAALQERWEKAKTFLALHGVSTAIYDDLPF